MWPRAATRRLARKCRAAASGRFFATGDAERRARLFSRLSGAMFADEAAALSLPFTQNDTDDASQFLPSSSSSPPDCESERVAESDGDLLLFSRAVRDLSVCPRAGNSPGALAAAVCAFIASDASGMNRAASELLLAGADVKALLSDGAIRDLRIVQKCMSQCDFSTVSFLSIHAEEVDFSRSLFYGAVFHDCVFVRCCFDGCVLKELRCSGSVRFEDCSLRFANIVLRVSSGGKAAPGRLVFDRCDFDLADFSGSDSLPARCFTGCYNTSLAAKFSSLFSA